MNKHRFFLVCLSMLAMLANSPAQPTDTTAISTGQDTSRLDDALLWRISRPDLPKESYLFGTIHIMDADLYFLPAGTEQAMALAGRLVFEIDMADMMDFGAQLAVLTKAFMKDGTRISDLVSPEDYQLIEQHFAGMGLPMLLLDRVKPMFLAMFASPDLDPGGLSSGQMKSYEMEFFDYAQEHNKPTGGLETLEFQLSIFDSIPVQAQAEMLVASIQAAGSDTADFQDMMDLYLHQDIEALYQVIGDDETGAGDFEDILVKNRNAKWIGGIEQYMREGPVFFAVGAGHLGGPHGVIRLLKASGFTVLPVLQMEDAVRDIRKF